MTRAWAVLLLLAVGLLAVSAGCTGLDARAGPSDSPGTSTTATAGTLDVPGNRTASITATGATNGSLVPAGGVEVTVVDVVDGDTLDVRYRNGSTDTVRLLGVDTPEVHVETSPGEFEGVPATDAGRRCLRAAGHAAGEYLRSLVADEQVRLVTDESADRRGDFGRLLAYVVDDGRNLNYRLAARGHARVYDSTFRYADRFYSAERRAQNANRGVWRCRDPASVLTTTASS